MMSVLDCRIRICFSLVVLKSDLDLFLITVPSFPASFRGTLYGIAGGGIKMGRGRRKCNLPPNDALQIVLWQMTFYKICYPEPL